MTRRQPSARGSLLTDSDTAKAGLRGSYDLSADRYTRYIAPSFAPIARRLILLARPTTDDLHLDLATGTGLVLAMADDRRIGSCITPWRVAADLSGEMLRAARLAAPATRLVQADLERLPFRDGVVDLLTLSLALHHLPRPGVALAELRRVLQPRGRLVLAAWADELSALWLAFDRWFESVGLGEPRRPAPPDALRFDTEDRLRAALLDVGGLGSVEVVRERPPLAFPSLADFWEWRTSFAATHLALAPLSQGERARLRDACLATLADHAGAGEVRADQAVLFALARP